MELNFDDYLNKVKYPNSKTIEEVEAECDGHADAAKYNLGLERNDLAYLSSFSGVSASTYQKISNPKSSVASNQSASFDNTSEEARYDSIAKVAWEAGFRGDNLVIAIAITIPESGGDPTKHFYSDKTKDDSYGLWQINLYGKLGPDRRVKFSLKSDSDLYNPLKNAVAAFTISGGANFRAWSTYKAGKHLPYIAKARTAAAKYQ